jgi:bifunctional UDP-N-acetylglucosamine pyrophosphorylase/glucosamine-1-phosphate N-acetyltransferase
MTITAVILAAGQGTRMQSKKPKVLHDLLGKPLLQYSLEVAEQITDTPPVVVIGHHAKEVQRVLGTRTRFVLQDPQLGTGHALLQAESLLNGKSDLILALSADLPLLTPGTLTGLIAETSRDMVPISLLTVNSEKARGFGRVLRDSHGQITAVVEEAQATAEQLLISELNVGVYCFRGDWLWQALPRIPISSKGEYYLTDLVEIAVKDRLPIRSILTRDVTETIGINNRSHLAEATSVMRSRINERWMLAGVTLVDPASTYIESEVEIGKDTVIWPDTYLQGRTDIGEDCEIGPNTLIRNAQIGSECKVFMSVVDRAVLEAQVAVGPFGHLRKGAHLCRGVHMGNFGEVKNSTLGVGTKMGHFSYIGDATIGAEVNIGAGTITCNFDGEQKNPTDIGDYAFIGSDTMLVAPVKLGEGAHTGAGAVVTKNVQPYTLAVGMPARSIRKLEKRD